MTINYSKQVLVKRGNTTVSSTYTGPLGEITLDTDLHQLRLHDGETAGGWLVPSGQDFAELQANVAALANVDIGELANITSLLANAVAQQDQIDSLSTNLDNLVNEGNVDPGTANETFWYNTEDGRLYIKWEDMWVDSNPTAIVAPEYIVGILEDFSGNIIPNDNNVYSLGSPTAQWKDLWVSNATIYLNSVPLGLDQTGNLTFDGNPLVSYVDGNLNVGGTPVSSGGTVDLGAYNFSSSVLQADNPIIRANDQALTLAVAGDPQKNWVFDNAGNLTLPGLVNGLQIDNSVNQLSFGPGESYSFLYMKNDGSETRLANDNGNVRISALDQIENVVHYWNFRSDGTLQLPEPGVVQFPFNGELDFENQFRIKSTIYDKGWYFQYNGDMLIPGDIESSGDTLYITNNHNTTLQWRNVNPPTNPDMRTNSTISITETGITLNHRDTAHHLQDGWVDRTWTFGTDGNLTLPSNGYILNSSGVDILSGLGGGNPFNQSLNTTNDVIFNTLSFPTNGLGAPTPSARSGGTKIVVWPESNINGHADYAIGMEDSFLWQSVPTTGTGFKWYAGNSQILRLDGSGKLTANGEIWAKAGDAYNGIVFSPNGTDMPGYIKVDSGSNMVAGANGNFSVKSFGNDRIYITDTDSTLSAARNTKLTSGTGNLVINSQGAIWTFGSAGAGLYQIDFPDGSKQITAYTGSTYGDSNVAAYLGGTVTIGNINLGHITFNGPTQTIGTDNGSGMYISSRLNVTGSAASIGLQVTDKIQALGGIDAFANVSVSGNVITTANVITNQYFIGDGSKLTNLTYNNTGNIIGTSSNVTLGAGSYNWKFDNTGNLTVPSSGAFVKNVRVVTGGVVPAGFFPTYYNPTTGEFIVVTS